MQAASQSRLDSTETESHVADAYTAAADALPIDPLATLADCETAREIEALDGDVIEQTEVKGGDRVRRTKWEIISQLGEIVHVQSGDILVRLCAGRPSRIVDVSDDLSSVGGIHFEEDIIGSDEETHPTHFRLLREALEDDAWIVAGTRTTEAANIEREGNQ
jgi:hypothetical protein